MPLTRLAFAAIDSTPLARREITAEIEGQAGFDQLCYFADQPASLAERQSEQWRPLIAWAADDLGLEFIATSGLAHRRQPEKTLEAVGRLTEGLDNFRLCGLLVASRLFHSCILAFALARGRLSAEEAFAASQLDEIHQAERWGQDAEAEARRMAMRREAQALGRWFASLSPVLLVTGEGRG